MYELQKYDEERKIWILYRLYGDYEQAFDGQEWFQYLYPKDQFKIYYPGWNEGIENNSLA